MKSFIDRFSGLVKGTISGFDRIVFKGLVLPLMSAAEVMGFCNARGILNKSYKEWMLGQTEQIIDIADQYAKDNCGQPVTHIATWRIRKEELAHERQQQEHITSGLISVWSCLERGSSFRAVYCPKTGYPQLRNYQTQCKYLYFYFDDSDYGFMDIRLQTWFPYHIQICLNGRECYAGAWNEMVWNSWSTAISFSISLIMTRPSNCLINNLTPVSPTCLMVLLKGYFQVCRTSWGDTLLITGPYGRVYGLQT